jgi:hypothetical protein
MQQTSRGYDVLAGTVGDVAGSDGRLQVGGDGRDDEHSLPKPTQDGEPV